MKQENRERLLLSIGSLEALMLTTNAKVGNVLELVIEKIEKVLEEEKE